MRSRSPRQFAVLLALCLLSRILVAQIAAGVVGSNGRKGPVIANQQPDIPTTTIHVSGVVVSALDSKPVPRVLVTSPDRRYAALTDWQGRFSFDYRMAVSSGTGALAGSFPYISLILRKPGYVNENQADRVPAPAPGTTTVNLQLKITPASAIVGHVTPDSGNLPNGLRAVLRRRQAQDGVGSWIQAASTQVDRNGEFRFANLNPGDYLVMTSGWTPPAGGTPQSRPDTTRGLLPTYYPGVATAEQATRIHVGPGGTEAINLRPASATFYRVAVGVDGINGQNFGASLLSDSGLSLGTNQAAQTVEGYLPSGSYTVRIETFNPNPGLQATANRPIPGARANRTTLFAHLEVGSAPIVGGTITAAPAADVQVNVTRNFTNTQQPTVEPASGQSGRSNPPAYIDLRSADDIGFYSNSEQDVQGDTITLHNIPEGTYHVHINAPQGYVASAMSGSTNLLTTPLTVGTGGSAPPIYVTLRDDFASISCQLQTGQLPQDNVNSQQPIVVFGIPLDAPEARLAPMGFYPQPFRVPAMNVAPGRYLLLALSPNRIQNLEYRDPTLLHELTSKGVTVTLSPGAKESVEVPFIPDGDN